MQQQAERIEDITSDPRIQNATEAWRIIASLLNADSPRSKQRALVRGMIDGNPPYNATRLKAAGQGHRTNLNFREAEGYVTARRSSFYDLVMNADPLVTLIPVKTPARIISEDLKSEVNVPITEYADVIARQFHNLLKRWTGFLFHTMRHQTEMVDYGVGPVMFPEAGDWRFKAMPMGDVLVPHDASCEIDNQELIILKSEMSVVDMHALVSDPEQTQVSAAAGWDTGLVKKVLTDTFSRKYRAHEPRWEDIQQQIKNNGLVESCAGPQPLVVYHVFYRTFSGFVGLKIVCSDRQETRFLYSKDDLYKNFSHVLNFFFAEVGDGTYHGVRGLGHKVFPHCAVSNDFLNTLVDGGKLAASAVVHQRTGASPDALKHIRLSPFAVMPFGYELSDKPFNPNLQGVASVREVLQGTLNANIGMFRPSGEGMGAKTAREVNTIVQREAQLETTDISFYYAQWDLLYQEMFRRLLDADKVLEGPAEKDRKEFIADCLAYGVPKELLKPGIWRMSANRTSGAGSQVMRDLVSREILELSPYLDGKGKIQAVRNRLLALVGPGNVDRYQGDQGRSEMPVVNSSLARLENGLMNLGNPATAAEVEDHLAHISVHLEGIQRLEESLDAGDGQPDFAAASASLSFFLQHIAEHLRYMQGNPAYRIESAQVENILKSYQDTLTQWQGAAQQQQQAAEAEAQDADKDSLELEKERLKTEATLRERNFKEENMAQVREAKAQHQMAINEIRTQHQMEMDRLKETNKIARG